MAKQSTRTTWFKLSWKHEDLRGGNDDGTEETRGLKQRCTYMTHGLDWRPPISRWTRSFLVTFGDPRSRTGRLGRFVQAPPLVPVEVQAENASSTPCSTPRQNNGQTGVSGGRYINVVKLFLTGVSPLEYQAIAASPSPAGTCAAPVRASPVRCSRSTKLRTFRRRSRTISHYNKFFDGVGGSRT